VYEGPDLISIPVSMENIPLFVRAGSVLPLEMNGGLELNIYPSRSGEWISTLYSDAGDGYGPNRTDTFRTFGERDTVRIAWDSTGEYPFPYPSLTLNVPHFELRECVIDGREAPVQGRTVITGQFRQVKLRFER
jgi:alpha-glucosidase